MRLDIWLWMAGSVLVLIAGLLRLSLWANANPRRSRLRSLLAGAGLWAPLVLTCLGLIVLVAGLVWRIPAGGAPLWPSGAWPGSTPADGVVMLAAGTLAILLWLMFNETRRVRAAKSRPFVGVGGEDFGLDRGRAVSEALALFGSCLLVLLAMAAAWNSPAPQPAPLARLWLFGLRVIAASLGLGVWLPAFVAEARALSGDAARRIRPGKGHSGPGTMSTSLGLEAMRAGYPWLTAACLLSAAWSLATAAALWRGLSPDAWLVVAWLLGGIYLVAAWGAHPVRLPRWALVLLTACGMAAAVVQAWQMPSLFS